MIVDVILQLLNLFLNFILTPFLNQADVVLSGPLANAIGNAQGLFSTINPLFPVDTLLICIGVIVGIEVAIFAYKSIMWLIKKIPTIS